VLSFGIVNFSQAFIMSAQSDFERALMGAIRSVLVPGLLSGINPTDPDPMSSNSNSNVFRMPPNFTMGPPPEDILSMLRESNSQPGDQPNMSSQFPFSVSFQRSDSGSTTTTATIERGFVPFPFPFPSSSGNLPFPFPPGGSGRATTRSRANNNEDSDDQEEGGEEMEFLNANMESILHNMDAMLAQLFNQMSPDNSTSSSAIKGFEKVILSDPSSLNAGQFNVKELKAYLTLFDVDMSNFLEKKEFETALEEHSAFKTPTQCFGSNLSNHTCTICACDMKTGELVTKLPCGHW
jgi:hypothetical protein